MNFNVFLQILDIRRGVGTVGLWTRILDAAVHPSLVFLHRRLVFEDVITMFAEVNNFVVLLQHVILQRLPFPTLEFTLFAFKPSGEDFGFLQDSNKTSLGFV